MYLWRVRMSYNPNQLLSKLPPSGLKDQWDDVTTEALISNLPLAVELEVLYKNLKAQFAYHAPAATVGLKEAVFISPESTQECKVTFSKPLETSLVETTIHHALADSYNQKGLLFNARDIHMVLASF